MSVTVAVMLRTTVDAPSVFGQQPSVGMTLTAESGRHSHAEANTVAARFPFAIQHLLGFDAVRHYHQQQRHHDVSPLTRQQSPMSAELATCSRPTTTDDVAYSPWTCLTTGHMTTTTCYRRTDAATLDDVTVRRLSVPSHGLAAASAAGLTGLPSPSSLLPTPSTDNVSGIDA